MNMSRNLILAAAGAILLVLLLVAGSAGYLIARPFSSDPGGQSRPSPDTKWIAHARSFQQGTLFGPKRNFFELKVESSGPTPQLVRRMVIEDTAAPSVDWRIEGEVFWNRNSSAVTFKCVTGKANLEITLAP
jgi:hypothetical protein